MKVLIVLACYLAYFFALASSNSSSVFPTTANATHLVNRTCATDDNRTGKWDYVSNCDHVTFLEKNDREITLKYIGYHNDELVICCVSRTELVPIPTVRPLDETSRAPPYCLSVDEFYINAGNINEVDEYKHMAALGYYDAEKDKFELNCGGTLISDRFVNVPYDYMVNYLTCSIGSY